MKELSKREREQKMNEETILTKAQELFCKLGYEKVSMDLLAKECDFTKRTLYRYFINKEDLYFAVSLRTYQHFFDYIKEQSLRGGTGFEKLRACYYAYYEYNCNSPHLMQLIHMKDIAKKGSMELEVPNRLKYNDFDRQLFEFLIGLFYSGKLDGSIRADLDITNLALSSVFLSTGFFQLFAVSGNTFTNFFSLDKEAFVKFSIDLLLNSIKN